MKILEDNKIKAICSEEYKYFFNKETGFFARYGKTTEDDPVFSPYGPEILDIEISTICHGINNKPCAFCYKSNTCKGENMSFETFKTIFHKLPKNLTQIAFGIGDIDSNPDLFKIMEYCRNNDYNYVVPNITINGWNLTDEYADKLSKLCGAVSVSNYDFDLCFNAVQKLTDRGMKQVNIHQLVAEETFETCLKLMEETKRDPRLEKLNAIVFLALKPKGKRNTLTPINPLKYKELVDVALNDKVRIGFDSCSAPMFLKAVEGHDNYKQFQTMAEPCESYLFSFYINVEGKTVPCSFLEDEADYKGLDVVNCNDFLKDIWYHPEVVAFRELVTSTEKNGLVENCRQCPYFKIYEDK